MHFSLNLYSLSATFLALIHLGQSYMVSIDTGAQDCFFERAQSGTKMSLMFEVVDGGFHDIELRITDPDGNFIHNSEKEQSGKYTFGAATNGVYTYCFANEKGSQAPKTLMFSMDHGEQRPAGAANEHEEGHTKLEDMIRELSSGLTSIKHEQEYMTVRDKFHRAINESTNSRVVLWSVFESLVLVLMTVGQVYYLKRFFEVRRVV